MRVVLDTNVLVSAVLTADGTCARIVDMLGAGLFELCADDRILAEYESVLHRPEFEVAPGSVDVLTDFIRHVALPVAAAPLPAELPDADDLPFLEVAAAAGALLVTGNLRHYPKRACANAHVLKPAEFVALIREAP